MASDQGFYDGYSLDGFFNAGGWLAAHPQWGVLDPNNNLTVPPPPPPPPPLPDAGAPAPVPDLSCLYIAAGAYVPTPQGPIQVTDPTLLVAYDDPIAVGDLVRTVVNPGTSELLLAEARVETITDHSPTTALMWRVVGLRHDEVI